MSNTPKPARVSWKDKHDEQAVLVGKMQKEMGEQQAVIERMQKIAQSWRFRVHDLEDELVDLRSRIEQPAQPEAEAAAPATPEALEEIPDE